MKKLTIENAEELSPYIKQANYNEYNSNIVTQLMWASMYEVQFETFEHYALAYTLMPHRSPIWMMPFCKSEYRKEAVDKIKELSKTLHIDFEIHSMILEFKNWLQDTFPLQFLMWDCYNARDYIYDRTQQQSLAGKKMQKRRNHFHAFEKEYEGRYQYKSLEEEDIPHIYECLQEWKQQKEDGDSIDAEEAGIHLLLSNLHTLPIQGGCIYIDGKLEAFTITSLLAAHTVQIHVEKANRNIRGLYIAILKCFLETLPPEILYVNREDDLGLEKLRKAKSDMQPISKTHKFGCCYQPLKIQKADASYLAQIQTLWKERFIDESESTTAYFFQHFYQPEDCYLLVSEEEVISMMQTRKMHIMLDGKAEQVSFIVGVATNKEYEGCGYMKQLMQYVLDDLRKSERFTLLQAYNWDIYKPFGFKETYRRAKIKVDKSQYTLSNGDICFQVDPLALLEIYQAYTKDKNGYRIRNEEYFKDVLAYQELCHIKTMVHNTSDCMDAYLTYSEQENEIHVHECVYRDEVALSSLLAILCRSDKKIYVYTDLETNIAGRRKEITEMMVKSLQENEFPLEHLFIHEEI